MKKAIQHSATHLLIVLFVAYYGSITLFVHTHNVNGFIVSHSHPFAQDHKGLPGGHQHSANGLLVIKALSGFLSVAAVLIMLLPVAKILSGGLRIHNNSNGIKETFHSLSYGLRAPPLAL